MTRGRSTAMLFMILMIIGDTLPAAATAPSHTPVPTATGVDGGGETQGVFRVAGALRAPAVCLLN